MQAYFDRRYSPRNVTVVATGNVNFDALVEKVSQMCSHWTPYDAPRQTPPRPAQARQTIVRDTKVTRQHIAMMSPAPSCQHESRYAAQLAAAIAGDPTGSRLYYALIEPALADEASVSYDPLDGDGAFLTFLSSDAEHAAKTLEIARCELSKFMAEGPTKAELSAAKNKIASEVTIKGELPMGRLTSVGFDWIYRQTYETLSDQIDAMFRVTRDDVTDLVRSCDLSAATMYALGPLETL
jgi:predicted Zn-dependent peptidase